MEEREAKGRRLKGALILFGYYNSSNGRNIILESALHGMTQTNIELVFFQDTKVLDGVYTRESSGYNVVATDTPSRHEDGMVVFYCALPRFTVEAHHKLVSNSISLQLESGGWRWYIVDY